MKRTVPAFLLALLALVALTACNQQSAQEAKGGIALVDPGKVFEQSEPGKAAMEYLKETGASMEADVKAAQEALQKEETEENKEAFQAAVAEYQATMGKEQQRVVKLLNSHFEKILETYRAANGLDAVLPKELALTAGPDADATEEIITKMNQLTINFTATDKQKNATAPAGAE